jgi:hypothetical protein
MIPGPSALHTFYLNNCSGLPVTNIDALATLPVHVLDTLDLSSCRELTNVDSLATVPALHSLDLQTCCHMHLTNIDSLAVSPVLHRLKLWGCSGLNCLVAPGFLSDALEPIAMRPLCTQWFFHWGWPMAMAGLSALALHTCVITNLTFVHVLCKTIMYYKRIRNNYVLQIKIINFRLTLIMNLHIATNYINSYIHTLINELINTLLFSTLILLLY